MVDMMTTNQQLFCELLDRSIRELSDIDVTFRDRGIEAAEKQLADYIRSCLKTENFFKIPYQPRENAWALPEDDDFAAAEKIIRSLASDEYLVAEGEYYGFLLKHSTGHKNKGYEVDVPLTYADYYFLEALIRWKSL